MSKGLPKTRLDLLMQLTEVSGKNLSRAIHVDMSLISRWKNGQRKIKDNQYTRDIASYFVVYDNGRYSDALHFLLKEKYQGQELIEALIKWLLVSIKPSDNPKYYFLETMNPGTKELSNQLTVYRSFTGDAGRREAVINLYNVLATSTSRKKLYIYNSEIMDWLYNDNDYLKNWSENMIDILEKGHEVHIIHNSAKSIDEMMQQLITWIPIYLTGKIHAYKLEDNSIDIHWETMYIVEDLYSLCGYGTSHSTDNSYTLLTNDRIAVQKFYKEFKKIFDCCTLLNKIQRGEKLPKYLSTFTNVGEEIDGSYFKSDELFFSSMSEELLVQVLTSNEVSKVISEQVINFHRKLNDNFQQNIKTFNNKHIYDLAALTEKARFKERRCFHLSLISGQDIFLSKKQYLELIKGVIKRLEDNENFNMGLFIPERTHLPLANVNLWIKDSYYVAIWDSKSDHMLMFTDPSIVEACNRLYENIWESIPFIDCEKKHIIHHLNKLLMIGEANQYVK